MWASLLCAMGSDLGPHDTKSTTSVLWEPIAPIEKARPSSSSQGAEPRGHFRYLNQPEPTFFCRAPLNSIYGFILGTYKIVGSRWLGSMKG